MNNRRGISINHSFEREKKIAIAYFSANLAALVIIGASQAGRGYPWVELLGGAGVAVVAMWNAGFSSRLLSPRIGKRTFFPAARARQYGREEIALQASAAALTIVRFLATSAGESLAVPLESALFITCMLAVLASFAWPVICTARELWRRHPARPALCPFPAMPSKAVLGNWPEHKAGLDLIVGIVYGGIVAGTILFDVPGLLWYWFAIGPYFWFLVLPLILDRMGAGSGVPRQNLVLGVICLALVSTLWLPCVVVPPCSLDGDAQMVQQFGGVRATQSKFSLARVVWGAPAADCLRAHDAVYLENGSHSLRFDAYLPPGMPLGGDPGSPLLPAVILLHGGGWQGEDKGSFNLHELGAQVASQGYAVFDIQYSLWSPAAPWKDMGRMMADIGAFTCFLSVHAQEYHVNMSEIVFLGRSAGGHLALLASLACQSSNFQAGFAPSLGMKGVVAFYPVTNLSRDPILVDHRPIMGGSAENLSPITYIQAGQPPMLLFAGQHDPYLYPDELPSFHAEALAVGQRSVLVKFPFAFHAFDVFSVHSPHGQVTISLVLRFLAYSLQTEA